MRLALILVLPFLLTAGGGERLDKIKENYQDFMQEQKVKNKLEIEPKVEILEKRKERAIRTYRDPSSGSLSERVIRLEEQLKAFRERSEDRFEDIEDDIDELIGIQEDQLNINKVQDGRSDSIFQIIIILGSIFGAGGAGAGLFVRKKRMDALDKTKS